MLNSGRLDGNVIARFAIYVNRMLSSITFGNNAAVQIRARFHSHLKRLKNMAASNVTFFERQEIDQIIKQGKTQYEVETSTVKKALTQTFLQRLNFQSLCKQQSKPKHPLDKYKGTSRKFQLRQRLEQLKTTKELRGAQ